MLSRMSAREFFEWQVYFRIEPWGEERADYRVAQLTALTANIHRDPKKKTKPFTVGDFMVDTRSHKERLAEQTAKLRAKELESQMQQMALPIAAQQIEEERAAGRLQ